jgi:hypothetical protein
LLAASFSAPFRDAREPFVAHRCWLGCTCDRLHASKAKQSKAKQSKAKQSKAKQSKAKQSNRELETAVLNAYVLRLSIGRPAPAHAHMQARAHSLTLVTICSKHEKGGAHEA